MERGEGGSVAPSEVDGADGLAVATAELFGKATVRGSELRVHRDEAVGEVPDGGGERGVRCGGRGEGAGGDGRGELLEEGEGGGRDVEAAELVPNDERVIELLTDGNGGEVPGL